MRPGRQSGFFIQTIMAASLVLSGAGCLARQQAGGQTPQTRATPQQQSDGRTIDAGTINTQPGSQTDSRERIFRGTVGDQSVELRLQRAGDALTGSYTYDRVRQPLDLRGHIDAVGNVELKEFDAGGKQTGKLRGRLTEAPDDASSASLEGQWSLPDGSREAPVYLTQQDAGLGQSLKIVPQAIRDKALAVNAVYPQLEPRSEAAIVFNRRIFDRTMKGVSEYKQAEPVPGKRSYTTNYNVLLASGDLLSVELNEDSYAGGAYPNIYSNGLTFDLRAGRELQLGDLFKPGSDYERAMLDYSLRDMNERIRRENEGQSGQNELTVSAETLGSPAGWALTRRGLVIYYHLPHVIAALGRVFIPFDALRDQLKPDGAAATFATSKP